MLSAIGEPLRAQIEVSLSPQELDVATPRLAAAGRYPAAGLSHHPALDGARVAIRQTNGRYYIDLVSTRVVSEPYLQLLLEIEVNGVRIVRGYTVLLDPPGVAREAGGAQFAPVVVTQAEPPRAVRSPVVLPAPVAVAASAAADREIKRLEAQLDAQSRTLAGMLERVAVMEQAVLQLQRQSTQAAAAAPPAASGSVVAASAAGDAAARSALPQPQTPVMPEPPPRPARNWTDPLYDNALLLLAGCLLVIFAGLAWVVWGPPSRKGAPAAGADGSPVVPA